MKYLKILLIFIPISIIGMFMHMPETLLFITSALAIIPLAGLIGEATEELTFYTGAKLGGFLNATFGNATEIIIIFFSIKAGLFDVVKASLVGSIMGNSLLVLGVSMLAGGLKFKTQVFNKKVTETTATMLLFAVVGLCVPAIFMHTMKVDLISTKYEYLSVIVAIIMFIVYILSLIFSFFTHKELFAVIPEGEAEEGEVEVAKWSLAKTIIILIVVTVCVAIESEILVEAVKPMTESLGLSQFFVGIILIPIIGNAAEHSTAVVMAMKNKMDIAIEIALGSSLQIILLAVPLAVFMSLFFTPMSIIFNVFELVALIVSVVVSSKVASDGESNWLEGVLLIAIYIILAVGFFILK